MLKGAALVTLVSWLFLRALSGSFAVAMTMPLALLASFVGLYYAGVPANLTCVPVLTAILLQRYRVEEKDLVL